jgi:hypothetical protein
MTFPFRCKMRDSYKEVIFQAREMERMKREEDQRFIDHNSKSLDLIFYNAQRGMSRAAMRRIWSDRLINLVLGHEEPK